MRRVSYDMTGKLPAPEEIQAFIRDTVAEKRAKLIDRLLESELYAVNWGRYWRDVLTYHTPASANYLRWQLFDAWVVEQVRRNPPFNDLVTAPLTAPRTNDQGPPANYPTPPVRNPLGNPPPPPPPSPSPPSP